MIREYALEPSMLNNWERFRYFVDQFGVPNGRLISRYPKSWKRMVYDALHACAPVEKKKIEERLRTIDKRMLMRSSPFDPQKDWLENAEAEHQVRPFAAVIANANPRHNNHVLVAGDIDEETPLWKARRGISVPRIAAALANAVAPLLVMTKSIAFVDPYFDPYRNRSKTVLRAYISKILARDNNIPISSIAFHTTYEERIRNFDSECCRQFSHRIPIGLRLKVFRWKERPDGEGFHNRYILTDRGGLQFAWGLDEGEPAHTDDITILEEDQYIKRWADYCSQQPAYDLVEVIEVPGTLRV